MPPLQSVTCRFLRRQIPRSTTTCCVLKMKRPHQVTAARLLSSSVTQSEVDKFNSLHSEWWDPRKNPLIHMNAIRIQYIQEQIAIHLPSKQERTERTSPQETSTTTPASSNPVLPFRGLNMLDIGCGGGLLSESLARLGANVTGIDPSPELLQVAQRRAENFFPCSSGSNSIQRPNYQCTTAENWSQDRPSDATYDVICLLEVVEHISHLESLWPALVRLLSKPHGLLFVSTMNRTALSYALTIVGAEYIMGYVPVGTHDWNGYQSPAELQARLEPFSLTQVDVCGMVLPKPPIQSWDWKLDRNNTDVNWIGTYQLKQ